MDDQVRSADPDRWLSSRFVDDGGRRADLIALYAFEAELMAIPTRVTQPLLAEMRYVWWREQMEGVFAGRARKGHPVLEALTDLVARHSLGQAPFEALIDAHVGRVQGQPHDLDAFYVGPMQMAVEILAGPGHAADVVDVARVRGLGHTGRHDEARRLKPAANAGIRRLPVEALAAVIPSALATTSAGSGLRRLKLIWAHARRRI